MNITIFIIYFKSVWFNNNHHWYIGASNYFPNTNNGLVQTKVDKMQTIKTKVHLCIPLKKYI